MHPAPLGNLLNFLAAEHENELVSTHKHVRDLDVLAKFEGLYQAPVGHLDIPDPQRPIAKLYLFVHYHLYSTVANLMRMHVSEALSCERKAIDAALSAYEMLEHATLRGRQALRQQQPSTLEQRHSSGRASKDALTFSARCRSAGNVVARLWCPARRQARHRSRSTTYR